MLFAGQSYYHAWYLSRELPKARLEGRRPQLGSNPDAQIYYHGEDFRLTYDGPQLRALRHVAVLLRCRSRVYDIFHFSNRARDRFSHTLHDAVRRRFGEARRSGC